MTSVFVVTTTNSLDRGGAEFEVVGVFLTMDGAREFCSTLPLHELDGINIWPQEVK